MPPGNGPVGVLAWNVRAGCLPVAAQEVSCSFAGARTLPATASSIWALCGSSFPWVMIVPSKARSSPEGQTAGLCFMRGATRWISFWALWTFFRMTARIESTSTLSCPGCQQS